MTLIYVFLRVRVVLSRSVSKVSRYREDYRRSGSGIVRALLIDSNSGSGDYPLACAVSTGVYLARCKATGQWTRLFSFIRC